MYFFRGALLRVDCLEDGRPDLGTDVAEVAVLLQVLHDQVFEFV